jgi:hypothetical protein
MNDAAYSIAFLAGLAVCMGAAFSRLPLLESLRVWGAAGGISAVVVYLVLCWMMGA